jgi:hypothetical protein
MIVVNLGPPVRPLRHNHEPGGTGLHQLMIGGDAGPFTGLGTNCGAT